MDILWVHKSFVPLFIPMCSIFCMSEFLNSFRKLFPWHLNPESFIHYKDIVTILQLREGEAITSACAYILWHVNPFIGNELTNTFPGMRKWKMQILGNQFVAVEATSVSMDMSNQQTFPRIPLRYISGRSDKNQVRSHVEAGSDTSTVALRVVWGNKKGTQFLGV
jgi:hypothetical protein